MTCIYVHAYMPFLAWGWIYAVSCWPKTGWLLVVRWVPTLLEAKAKAVAKGSENSTAPGSRSSGAGLVGKE